MKIKGWVLAAAIAAFSFALANTAPSAGKVNAGFFDGTKPIHSWFDGNNPVPPGQKPA